jgi:ribonuclease E
MKRMLINATQTEERRLAIVDGQKLLDFETEIEGREQRKGNIYKAVVRSIEPSLEACFVDYGEDRNGFLPFKEISRNYFREGVEVRNARIQDAIREGDQLLVQVEKEERGNKGAALTTFVSLAGRYLVLMPNNPRGGGVSRRIEGEEREELKENLDQLQYPNGMSLIARTAGIGRSAVELQWDLDYMLTLWKAIDGAAHAGKGAFLIYQESSLVIRAIRDYFTLDVGEILIDTDDIFDQAQQFMRHVMPDSAIKVKRYRDDAPLFSRFQIEHQIETAFSRTVNLPSGGAIVIDHTEALVSVDVNSARATRGSDIEETATRTNLEAADEIARQMRLRDLGGLIVVDFIDMEESKNRRDVEHRLRDALRQDRARVQFGTISKFGLLELSRQRLRPALSEGSHITCPRCNGTGHIRDTESSALQILRMVQEESIKENTVAVHVQVPIEVTSFLLNEKRTEIAKIELQQRIKVLLIPNKHLDTPNYRLERLRHDDPRLDTYKASYTMIEEPEENETITRREKFKAKQEPLIKGVLPNTLAPLPPKKPVLAPIAAAAPASSGGFFSWIKNLLGGNMPPSAVAPPVAAPTQTPAGSGSMGSNNRREHRSNTGSRNERSHRGGSGRTNENGRREAGNEQRPVRNNAARTELPPAEGISHGASSSASPSAERSRNSNMRSRGAAQEPRSDDAPAVAVQADNRKSTRGDGMRSPDRLAAKTNTIANSEANTSATTEAGTPNKFVDTIPGDESADTTTINAETGERTGRRRNRRGGRGSRDRDDTRPLKTQTTDSTAADTQDSSSALAAQNADQITLNTPSTAQTRLDSALASDFGPDLPPETDDLISTEPRRRGRGGRSSSRGDRARHEDAQTLTPQGTMPQPAAADSTAAGIPSAATKQVATSNNNDSNQRSSVPAMAAAFLTPATAQTSTEQVSIKAQHGMSAVAPATPFVLPTVELKALAEQSGLQWVGSDARKIRAAQEALAIQPKPIHRPREIAQKIEMDHGPLVLVETQKNLVEVKLPFDVS